MNDRTTTQQQHPAKAAVRTAVQGFLGTLATLGLVLPIAASIISTDLEQYLPPGWGAWLIAVAAFVAALAGAVARIMAIPGVDAALKRLGLSSGPEA